MFEVSVTGQFTAAHRLRRSDGTAEELHEHDWRVRATYVGPELDEMGLLVDFGALRAQLSELLTRLDGRNLNDLPPFAERNTSAENVAWYVARELCHGSSGPARLKAVEVEEEPGCRARYFPPQR